MILQPKQDKGWMCSNPKNDVTSHEIPFVWSSTVPHLALSGTTRDRDLAVTHLWQVLERLQEVPHPVTWICYWANFVLWLHQTRKNYQEDSWFLIGTVLDVLDPGSHSCQEEKNEKKFGLSDSPSAMSTPNIQSSLSLPSLSSASSPSVRSRSKPTSGGPEPSRERTVQRWTAPWS